MRKALFNLINFVAKIQARGNAGSRAGQAGNKNAQNQNLQG